jgi:hypothetical protein
VNRSRSFSFTLMQLALSLYFIVLGIQEVSGSQKSDLVRGMASLFKGSPAMNDNIQLVIGILALVSGFLLLLSVFQLVRGGAIDISIFLIFLFWLVRIVYVRFILEVNLSGGTLSFYPNLEQWLLVLSHDILVLCSAFLILRLPRE